MAKDKKDQKKNQKPNKEIKPITQDSRFKQVHNDPRFKFPSFKNLKIKVDDRFNKKELEKLNHNNNVKIDRYGRKLNKNDSRNNVINKFIEHEDEDEDDEEEEKSEEESEEESEDDESEDEEDDEVSKLAQKIRKEESELDRARGEGMDDKSSSSSSEEEEEEESSDESDVSLEDLESEEESEVEIEESKPQDADPTKSFAVVNMDWDNLRAEDLMATFISFVPKGGSIKSVKIYPSEFGKERMQKEEIEGPSRDIFKSSKKSKKKSTQDSDDDSDSDIDSDIDINDAKELERVTKKLYEQDDGKEDYDSKALRKYQLQRLRYFYAVVECDSINTSQNIYKNVDGTEYESTANIFDLRYIPDDMIFDELDVKDECFKISKNYRPDSKFVTDALQHSKVKLTWDETPKERLTLSSRPLSQREIEDNDFKAYLASDSEDDKDEKDEDSNDLKTKYQSLLGNTFQTVGKEDKDEEEDDVDMEITFDPGLKDGKNESDEDKEETTIDAYKRKEKERRQRRLNKYKESKEVEEDEEEENYQKNKSKHKKHNKKSKDQTNLTDKQKAELELVLMDNEATQQDHFNMKDVLKNEKNLKNKKKNKKVDSEMTQDNFNINLQDSRFNEIFENHEYAIDPSNSEFKKSSVMNRILKERSARNNKSSKNGFDRSKKRKFEKSNSNSYDDVKQLAKKLKNRK
ncbi:ESF1 [Candida jiufengensis]|uniref:ESF1 n=1 Tax=Candida jiufengensis TaxID=497108 RepID=UPI002224CF41|nr:ESF1 [Candida jiufengensis]KAI5951187.1 ESF1 [Candida jiufengensis]